MAKLAENVFILADVRPTKEDANEQGYVLYFSLSCGWYQGHWHNTYMKDITHWTYLPERPPAQENPVAIMHRTFDEWVNEKFPNAESAAKMLLRLGYEAGFMCDKKVQ